MPPFLLALALMGAVLLLFVGLALPFSGRDPVQARLAQFANRPRSLEELELEAPLSERVLKPIIRRLSQAVMRFQNRSVKKRLSGTEAIQRKLNLAGNPWGWTPADYVGVKAFAGLGGAAFGFFLLTVLGKIGALALLAAGVGALSGWFLPDLLLRQKAQQRQREIVRALPDALDLLVISVEAGLGFDSALYRLVEKSDNPLTREFARVLAEIRVGRPRREALRDMIARTEVPDLSNFISAVIQADQLGVSVTKVLAVHAEQMRTVRRQRAEEAALKAPLKMIFPLAMFVFPALCIVILGPIWPAMAKTGGFP
jgi:tight adherence protein C